MSRLTWNGIGRPGTPTHLGPPCKKCGHRVYYTASQTCRHCVMERSNKRRDAELARQGMMPTKGDYLRMEIDRRRDVFRDTYYDTLLD
jgi:ribosomal protein L37E